MSRRPLVIGNWKMNGSLSANASLLHGLASSANFSKAVSAGVEVGVCPSPVHVAAVGLQLASKPGLVAVKLGAQDVSEHNNGAFTGETSASMLKDVGVHFALIGHSERRSFFGDTNARVLLKTKAALSAGLVPVICVGETLAEREGGQTEAVIKTQIEAVGELIATLSADAYVLAYEPVWAIGTGKTASPEQAQQVHAMIRQRLQVHGSSVASKVRILYGGSVKATNAAELFGQADIDGGLIGGAALQADDFAAIAAAAIH